MYLLTVNTVLRLRDNIETKLRRTLCLVVIKVKHKFEAIIKYCSVHIYSCRSNVCGTSSVKNGDLNPFTFKLCGNNEISKSFVPRVLSHCQRIKKEVTSLLCIPEPRDDFKLSTSKLSRKIQNYYPRWLKNLLVGEEIDVKKICNTRRGYIQYKFNRTI